jgi:hypothetical protein
MQAVCRDRQRAGDEADENFANGDDKVEDERGDEYAPDAPLCFGVWLHGCALCLLIFSS